MNIKAEFSVEEFETALITPNNTLADIHIPLLRVSFIYYSIVLSYIDLLVHHSMKPHSFLLVKYMRKGCSFMIRISRFSFSVIALKIWTKSV